MTRQRQAQATAIGLLAIGLWSGLALSTVAAAGIPPFQLLTLSFGVAFASGMIALVVQGRRALSRLRQPRDAWVLAFLAIFLYHTLYFYALSAVPAAQASLVAYLWPLLIVLFSALAPGGGRLRLRHLAGAALGLAGAALLFLDDDVASGQTVNGIGYLAALGCALIWSGYSVLNRRFAHVPSDMLIGVCGAVALAGGIGHLVFEQSVWPRPLQWAAILFLGIGPTGLAFLAWDHATKHGNTPLLGALSYLTPLLSTLLLVASGQAPGTILIGISALLIVAGALLASLAPVQRRLPKVAADRASTG
ncbi:aromatic amino acid exporter YddG [Paracoccus sp. (in: a-proteobacteria)]|uniref:aromatic amino acid exporter YddG n=1 Tax=Paracoccus sp. TaxID=267 RepID=UPI00272A2147|nr:DMT family transporter [Paracoccus sp. (in: a-proteobacteria)]